MKVHEAIKALKEERRKKMPNHMKFCGCKWCRAGMRCRPNSEMIKRIVRLFRRKGKEALRQGKEPDKKISVPYTD